MQVLSVHLYGAGSLHCRLLAAALGDHKLGSLLQWPPLALKTI